MSDEVGTTIRYLFVGDSASLQEAFDQAAAAAQASLDKINAAADEASGSLDGTGASVEGLGAKFDQAGAQATGLGEKLDTIGEGAGASIEGLDAKFVGLGESVSEVQFKLEDLAGADYQTVDEIIAKNDQLLASLGEVGTEAEVTGAKLDTMGGASKKVVSNTGGATAALASFGKVAAVGLGGAAVASIYLGMKFQTAMTQLVTGAGESQKNLGLVSNGIQSLAGKTATSTSDLAAGMYMIESAGFHGAQGLAVLQASAEGAKVGAANLADVANVVTSALNAYGMSGKDATSVTNELVATVAAGKMHMQDLATAVAAVLPVAASAHIAFSQVGGAIATMTAQGMTARRASMGLANMIRALIAPSTQASDEMKMFGLNANEVAQNVGKVGLTGTLDQLTEAVLRNSKGGSVLAGNFNDMGESAKHLATQILEGTISSKALGAAMGSLSPEQAALVTKFKTTALSATGLKETFDAAMKTMVGGATGLNVALLLSGTHAQTFAANVGSVAAAAQHSSGQVQGFALIQKDLAFQLDSLKDSVEAVSEKFGTALIPILEKVFAIATDVFSFIANHKEVLIALAVVIGGVVVSAIATWTAGLVASALAAVAAIAPTTAFGAAAGAAAIGVDSMAAPIAAVVAAIALLAVAAYEIYKHWGVIWPEVKKIASDVWHDIQKVIHDAWEVILTIFKNATIVGLIYSHWTQIENDARAVWHAILSFLEGIPGDIIGIFSGALRWLEKAGKDIIMGLWHGLEMLTPLYWILKYKTQIIDVGRDAITWLVNAGYDIIMGLWHGIENGWNFVSGLVSGVAHKVTSLFHDALSIFSPSKVFDEIGRNIMLGLGQGITGGAPDVYAKLGAVAKGLNPALSAGLGSFTVPAAAGALGAAAGGSRASSPLTINFSIDGQRFATAVVPDLVTAMQQRGRVINLGI